MTNIISFKNNQNKINPLLNIKKNENIACFHQFELDRHKRIVECLKCKKRFDAFEALMQIAFEWDSYSSQSKNMKKEISKLNDYIAILKKEIINLKNQQRKLHKEAHEEKRV